MLHKFKVEQLSEHKFWEECSQCAVSLLMPWWEWLADVGKQCCRHHWEEEARCISGILLQVCQRICNIFSVTKKYIYIWHFLIQAHAPWSINKYQIFLGAQYTPAGTVFSSTQNIFPTAMTAGAGEARTKHHLQPPPTRSSSVWTAAVMMAVAALALSAR